MSVYVRVRLLSRMATPTKGKTLHIYIQDETLAHLVRMSDAVDMPHSTLAGRLLTAALECCAANGYRMTLPLKFTMTEEKPPNTRK